MNADLDHAASASGANIDAMPGEDCIALAIISGFNKWSGLGRLQNDPDGWELAGPAGVGQETEVPDAAKSCKPGIDE